MKIKPCTECFCFPCTLDTRYSQEVQESTALNNKIHLIHLAWNFRKIISCSNKVGLEGGGCGHNPLYGCDSELVMTELNAYNKIRVQSAYVGCGVELSYNLLWKIFNSCRICFSIKKYIGQLERALHWNLSHKDQNKLPLESHSLLLCRTRNVWQFTSIL